MPSLEVHTGGLTGRLLFIMNPVAGRMTIKRHLPDVIRTFTDYGWLTTVLITEKPGDATRFAADYGGRFDRIVCAGGDGTLHETLNGIAASGLDVPMGYIPAGSTNVFAECHGFSADVLTAAADAASGVERRLDIGLFNDRYFAYTAAFGAFSWLSYTTPQPMKNLLGRAAYFLDGIKDLNLIRSEHLLLQTENTRLEGDFAFCAVSNATSIACTFPLPRDVVRTDDGLFEIILIRLPETLAQLQSTVQALRTQDYACDRLEFLRAGEIQVRTGESLRWTLDGEMDSGGSLISIRNIQRALRLVAPK